MSTRFSLIFLLICRMSPDELNNNRQRLESLKYGKYVGLWPHVNDVKGFYPYIGELKKSVFIFKKEDAKTAKQIFHITKNTYRTTKKLSLTTNITMVSIHIRLTDFAYHLKSMFNMTFVSNEFLTKAMEYYTNKYAVS